MGMSKEFLKGLMTAGAGAAAYGLSAEDAEAADILSKLKRAKLFGVGKDIGDKVYIHKRYEDVLPQELLQAAKEKLPPDMDYNALAYGKKNGNITFTHSPDFDTAAEPIVGRQVLVKSDGTSREITQPAEPSVYFSTSKEGTGYGPAVVEAKVPGSMLQLDDVFPDGRADFRVDKSTLPLAYAKRIAGLGLTGAGAYGLMSPDSDANAMSYIGPKGMANLLGPDAAKSLLSEADQLAAKGVDNEAIRQATGVFKGMDGKWRYEISDGMAFPFEDPRENGRGYDLKDAFIHDDLFKAYPQLGDIWLNSKPSPGATFSPSDGMGVISLGPGSDNRGSILHELQHAIQQREGFARGGSPSEFTQVDDAKLARDALSFRRELDKMPGGMDSLAKENAIVKDYQDMEAMDFLPSREARDLAHDRDYNPDDQLSALVKAYGLDKHVDMTPKRAYDFLAGEIEARDVAARMNLTPEQRRATPPDLRDNAIVRFDGNEAASVPQRRDWAKDAGSNTPSAAQAVAPSDPFAPSPSKIATTAALIAALKSKDAPLEDTYQPADFLTAFLTGGGGLLPRAAQAAADPVFSAGMEYLPRFADAINPRNIIAGLMR